MGKAIAKAGQTPEMRDAAAVLAAYERGEITDEALPAALLEAELLEARRRITSRELSCGEELQPATVRAAAIVSHELEADEQKLRGIQRGLRSCRSPIIALCQAGEIDEWGLKAALRFGALASQVYGAPRVAVSSLAERIQGGEPADRDCGVDAQRLYDAALSALTKREAAVLAAVVRFDMTFTEAARAAHLRGSQPVLSAQAKVLTVQACETLSELFRTHHKKGA
jgi:hypothetical protein